MNMNQPDCFGDLDRVFPLTSDGLRHSPDGCLACEVKTLCLKTAIAGDKQVVMANERLDRAYRAGAISFLKRWSEKKRLHNILANNSRTDIQTSDPNPWPARIPDAPFKNDDNYS